MTTKRKAELQRKLALAPVPKPPVDLADRIKGEIPKQLMVDTTKERARFRQAIAFNVRVAASILLLVSSVYLALHLLSRKLAPEEMASTASTAVKEPAPAAPVALPTTPPPPMSTEAKAETRARKPIVVAESRRDMLNDSRAKKQPEETAGTAAAQAPALAEPAPAAAPMAKSAAVAFDVEASAAPFDASKQIVRVSLDGVHNAAPEVAFNDDAVASWHTIAYDGTLYEITLRPHTGANDIIATARVNNVERVIRRGDVHAWDDASQRMKAASLAAALDAGVPPKEVAAKARAAGLDDLAAAAEARAKH